MKSVFIVAALSVLGLGCQSASAVSIPSPSYIDSLGREWLTPNYTRDRTWNEVESVCDYQTGLCNGELAPGPGFNSYDVTGYVWATRDEVRDLVYEVTGLPSGELDDYQASGSDFADELWRFFEVFDSTMRLKAGEGFDHFVAGFTRDVMIGDLFGAPALFGNWSYLRVLTDATYDTQYTGTVVLDSSMLVTLHEVSAGAFLYRPTHVPEPGMYALFGSGLLLLGIARRRRLRVSA